jgi:hypothetical protein
MSYFRDRRFVFVALVGILGGTAMAQSKPSARAAKEAAKVMAAAEASYRRQVAEADAAHEKQLLIAREALIKQLEKLKIEASKAVEVRKAVAIEDRIAELKNPPSQQPNTKTETVRKIPSENAGLLESITGTTWTGSHHGLIKFAATGFIEASKPNIKPWRWAVIDENTVLTRYEAGNIDVLVFNPARDSVISYHMGIPRKEHYAWSARKVPAN